MPSTQNDIKIVARLDYTQFKKGMKEINSEYSAQKTYVNALERQIKDTFDIKNVNQFDNAIKENEKAIKLMNDRLELSKEELKDMAIAGKENTKEFIQLKTQITKMETELSKAEQKQEKFNKNVEALKTEKYEDLSDDMKRIAKQTGQATDEELKFGKALKTSAKSADDLNDDLDPNKIRNYGEALDESDNSAFSMGDALEELTGSSDAANTAVSIGTKLMNPYVAAVAGAVAVVKKWADEEKRVSDAVKTTTGVQVDSVTTTKGYTKQVNKLAKAYDLEYNEALEISIQQQTLFNSTVLDGDKGQQDFQKTLALSYLNMVDYEEGLKAVQSAEAFGNDTREESIGLLFEANEMMNKYGAAADDVLDAYGEFGQYYDSFEKFLQAQSFALEAGVKDLGAFNDGINEFNTNVREMSTQYQDAMKDIEGASDDLADNKAFQKYIDDTYQSIEDGTQTTATAFADLISKLADMEDPVKRDAIAISLFGDTALEQIDKLIEFEERTGEISYALDYQAQKAKEAKERNKELVDLFGISQGTVDLFNEVINGTAAGYEGLAKKLGLTNQEARGFTEALNEGLPYAQNYLREIGVGEETIGAFSEAFRAGDEELAKWGATMLAQQSTVTFFSEGLKLNAEDTKAFTTALNEGLPSVVNWFTQNGYSAQAAQLLADKTGLSTEQIGILTQAMLLASDGHKDQAAAILEENGMLDLLYEKNLLSKDTYDDLTTSVQNQKQVMNELKTAVSKLTGENGLLNKSTKELKTQFGLSQREASNLKTEFRLLTSQLTDSDQKIDAFVNSLEIMNPDLHLSKDASSSLKDQLKLVAKEGINSKEGMDALQSALKILTNNGFKPSDKATEAYKKTMEKLDKSTNNSSKSMIEMAEETYNAKDGMAEAESAASDSQTTFQNLKGDIYNLGDAYDDLGSSAATAASEMNNADSAGGGSGGGLFGGIFSSPVPQASPAPQSRSVSNQSVAPRSITNDNSSRQVVNIQSLTVQTQAANANEFIDDLRQELYWRT